MVGAKHMTHAVATALLGIPGDTMAPPLMREANFLRNLGVPHIALRKMISGAVIAALVAEPLAVLWASVLALLPFVLAIIALQTLTGQHCLNTTTDQRYLKSR